MINMINPVILHLQYVICLHVNNNVKEAGLPGHKKKNFLEVEFW